MVAIFEPNASGHRLMYVRLLILACIERQQRPILVTTPAVPDAPEYLVHLDDLAANFATATVPSNARPSDVQGVARELGAALLVVPDGNLWATDALLDRKVGRTPETRLLLMRDPRWELMDGVIGSPRAILKTAFLRVLETFGKVQVYWLREPGSPSTGPRYVVDPIILDGALADIRADSLLLRSRLGMSEDKFWFGVTGVLSDEKLSTPLLRALSFVSSASQRPIGLALIGPTTSRATWPKKREEFPILENAIIADGILSNYEVGVAIQSLDCLIASYLGVYGPSATLAKAAALGVRTVSAGPASMRHFAKHITARAGVTLETEALSNALLEVLNTDPPKPLHQVGHEVFTEPLLSTTDVE